MIGTIFEKNRKEVKNLFKDRHFSIYLFAINLIGDVSKLYRNDAFKGSLHTLIIGP